MGVGGELQGGEAVTDILGPCPACGHPGSESREGDYDSTIQECGNQACTFACPPVHWNMMHLKMTREDADALIDELCEARESDIQHAYYGGCSKPEFQLARKQWADASLAIVKALCGEK